jgi:hypothetical protein
MVTKAQLIANRENSKHSTGPRTIEGKARSSHNHITHGLNAADPVLPTEDRNEFNALLERYIAEWTPATPHQEFLVAQMTGARWKLDRIERIETEMFAALDDPRQAFTDPDTAKGFARLDRYRASLERTYHRCTRELRASRKEQFEANSREAYEFSLETVLKRMLGDPLLADDAASDSVVSRTHRESDEEEEDSQ